MLGVLFSAISGAAMSLQGVINTRVGEKIGLYESNAFVQGTAFLLGLAACIMFGKGEFLQIRQLPWYYWTGGVLGFLITVTVMKGIGNLGPTFAIAVILISQLLVAAVIDAFGLLGSEKVAFVWTKWLGLGLMIAGIVAFKWEAKG